MTLTRLPRCLPPLLGLVLVTALLSGCSDNLMGADSLDASSMPDVTSKLRHGHMLADASKLAGKSGRSTGIIVKLKPQKVLERYKIMERYRIVERYKIMERYTYEYAFGGFAITADTDALPELFAAMSLDPDIEWFEPDFTVSGRPFALGWQSKPDGGDLVPWSLEKIGAVQQDKIKKMEDVVLFIVDTGVQSQDVNLESEFDFGAMASSNGVDRDGHGTHIAGIASARINNSGLAGIAPNVRVHSLKVLGNESAATVASDDLDLSTAIMAVEHITRFKHENRNAPVVANLSFGAYVGTTEYTALDEAIATSSTFGVTYVVSAGNDGADASEYTPAHTREAITVGAYDPLTQFAAFSNHGPLLDILAPGVDVLSLKAGEPKDSRNFAMMSGTSMAAAHVSGAVARFLAINPQATPDQVGTALVASGRDWVVGVPSGTTSRSVYVGAGHLDGAAGGDGLVQYSVGPFPDYAIFGEAKIKIEGTAFVSSPTGNANVFTNGSIKLATDLSRIAGFGYFKGGIDEAQAHSVFTPVSNPMNLSAFTRVADQTIVEQFKAKKYRDRATRVFNGDQKLSGAYHLNAGDVWYFAGDLKTEGPTEFTGTGLVIVRGSVVIRHSFSNTGGAVGLYAGGSLKAKNENGGTVNVTGTLYAGSVELETDTFVRGQITTTGKLVVRENATLDLVFERTPEALVRPLWGI
jgi:subtilisin family serine protease